jgi:uncharacterized membrane protein YbaN (DUF454 family)
MEEDVADQAKATWLKYPIIAVVALVAVLLTPRFTTAPTWGHSFMVIAITVAVFAIMFIVHRLWRAPGEERLPKWRFVAFFLFLILVLLALQRPWPRLSSWLSRHPGFDDLVARLVDAGGGWLLPSVLLVLFIAVMWKKRGRARK